MSPDPTTVSIARTVAADRAREVAARARAGQDLMTATPGYLGSGWAGPDPGSPSGTGSTGSRMPEASPRGRPRGNGGWSIASTRLGRHSAQERRTGVEGWFNEPSFVEVIAARPAAPPRWKRMASISLVVFTLSLGANALLGPLTGDLPRGARRASAPPAQEATGTTRPPQVSSMNAVVCGSRSSS